MNEAGRFKKALITVAFMFLVTLFFISALSLIYGVTRETILLNESLDMKRAVLYAAGLEPPGANEALEELYQRQVEEIVDDRGIVQYFKIVDPSTGKAGAYAFMSKGKGLWGEIVSVVGIDSDLKSLIGIDFIKQNETPGLGARITEAWFKEQFRGKRGPFSSVPEGEPTTEQQFQAITGASYTTGAVLEILNSTLAEARRLIGGGS